jgi:hypothetical protein
MSSQFYWLDCHFKERVMQMSVEVKNKFEWYPDSARLKLLEIRRAIYEVAESESIG